MIVYIPINREDIGLTVQAIPSEQLVYISNKRCLKKSNHYETDFAYNTDYLFRTEKSAWDFLMNKKVADDFYYCRQELWPHKNIPTTAKEDRILKKRRQT